MPGQHLMLIFSPDTIYKPAFYKTGRSTDPCLLPGSQLEVGYTPHERNLADGVQIGVTYLKAFMSNEYVDLSYFEKSFSPFDKGSGGEKLLTCRTSQSDEPEPLRLCGGPDPGTQLVPQVWTALDLLPEEAVRQLTPLWGTLLVPIVIERRENARLLSYEYMH